MERSTSSSSIPAITGVLENPFLSRLIFDELHRKQSGPLLCVSSLFFHAIVSCLYRVYDYGVHPNLIKRCKSDERFALYIGAVRTIDLDGLTRAIEPAHWAGILSKFPHAVRIKRWSYTLSRRFSPSGDPEYTYHVVCSERLTSDSEAPPPRPLGIPAAWQVRPQLSIIAYPEEYNEGTDQGVAAFKRDLMARVKALGRSGGQLREVAVRFPLPCSVLLSALQELKKEGYMMPSVITLRSFYDGGLNLLNFLAPTLEHVHTDVGVRPNVGEATVIPLPTPSYDYTDVTVEDVLQGIDWKTFTRLRGFRVSCRRPSASPSSDLLTALNPLPPTTYPGTYHCFGSFVLQFVYPPNVDLAMEQVEVDIAGFPVLAERLLSLVPMWESPRGPSPRVKVVFPGETLSASENLRREVSDKFNLVTAACRNAGMGILSSSSNA
ncbi:hypothetical protein IAT38_003615 [Cryptococcus sp. DSM 104549]